MGPECESTSESVEPTREPWESLLPGAIILTAAIVFLSPPAASPLLSQVVGLPVALLVVAALLLRGTRMERRTWTTLAIASLPVTALFMSAVSAPNPSVSLLGLAGQHNGALLWLTLLTWMLVGSLSVRGAARRSTVKAIAVAGAVSGLAAGGDALGLFEHIRRFSTEPAGFFESSVALGQFSVIAAACGVAWFLAARRSSGQGIAAAVLVLDILGVALSHSSTAYIGAAFSVVFALAIAASLKRSGTWTGRSAVALGLIVVVVLGTFFTIAVQGPGSQAFDDADDALNGRITLWYSAFERLGDDPLLGRGPDQYTAWIDWGPAPDGSLNVQGANDPHNVLLALLSGGGLLGLILGLLAAVVLSGRLLTSTKRSSGLSPTVALVAGLAGWTVTLTTGWTDPLAGIAAATVTGVVLAGTTRSGSPRGATGPVSGVSHGLAACATIMALGSLVVVLPSTSLELHWASGEDLTVDEAVSARESPDPTFDLEGVRRLLGVAAVSPERAPETLDQATEIVYARLADASWHVDLAIASAEVAQARSMLLGEDTWEEFKEALTAGSEADPSSGLWCYAGAIEASRLGHEAESRDYAAQALEKGVPAEAASILEELVR